MTDVVRRWVARAATAVLLAVAFWYVAGLVGYHTRLAADASLALLLSALVGFTRDTGPGWAVSMPAAPTEETRAAKTQDARLSLLRRTIEDAVSRESHTNLARTAPSSLQRSLRAVAAHRVGRRTGLTLDPEDRDDLATHLDPVLAEYLCPSPPPPVDEQRLTDLIRRIENL